MDPQSVIAFFSVEDWERDYLAQRLPRHRLHFFTEKLTAAHAAKLADVSILSTFISDRVTKAVLARLPALRFIATRSTGYDHIDFAATRARGIAVANVPTYGANTVAEHTFALILALSRKIHLSYERTTHGDFSREHLRGFDLKGKTIGIVGIGNIGLHVARIAKGFQMRVLAYDPRKNIRAARRFGFRYVPLSTLIHDADIVTLHVPYAKATRHLIGATAIRRMKKTALLINTARGGIVDTHALVRALDAHTIGGAGLDVLEEEGIIAEERELLRPEQSKKTLRIALSNYLLLTHKHVVVTPHNAFNSHEALQRILDTTLDNIRAFLRSKPINVVNA